MAKEPKANWSLYTKAELVKMIKNYDKRQAVLLNRIAKLEGASTARNTLLRDPDCINEASLERALVEIKHPSEQKGFKVTDGTLFPWQAVLDATKDYS